MKIIFLFQIVIALVTMTCYAQDKTLEFDMLKRRESIRRAKIKEQVEMVFQEWKQDCQKDSAKIRNRYVFDKLGNLIQVDEYGVKRKRKTIHYERGKNGWYTKKEYWYYDSLGNVQNEGNWRLVFDSMGRPVREELLINNKVERTNAIAYDNEGNYVEQMMDGWMKWLFQYDKDKRLIGSNECRLETDTTVCYNHTRFTYVNNQLMVQEKYDATTGIPFEVKLYDYDTQGKLTSIKESRVVRQIRSNVPETKTIRLVTTFQYDENGNLVLKSLGRPDEPPYRCYFYSYKFFGTAENSR
jgi:hypothetical protein